MVVESAIQSLINYTSAFGALLAMLFFFLNIQTKGFLFQFLRVKASQGRFILARVHSLNDIYYRVAKFEEGFFKVKLRSKERVALPLGESAMTSYFSSELTVTVVSMDETGKKLLNFDFKGVSQFDNYEPGRTESLLLSIKNRPVIQSKKEQIIMIAIFLTLLAVLFIAFQVMQLEEAITALGTLSGNI